MLVIAVIHQRVAIRRGGTIKKLLIAFDVDGCLIDEDDQPREDVIIMLKLLSRHHKVMVWSGGGKDYAQLWVRRLKLEDHVAFVDAKNNLDEPDISIDDEDQWLAKVNLKV